MALRKLWNSIFGRDTGATCSPEAEPDAKSPVGSDTADLPVEGNRRPGTGANAARPKPGLSRADKKLCRRIESLTVRSVLEVSVGDGARSKALLAALSKQNAETPLLYVAIDQFELGEGSISLREFHQMLRGIDVKAQLVPMEVTAGLDRVVRTVGQIDLILWAVDEAPSREQLAILKRLSKSMSILIRKDEGVWSETRSGVSPLVPQERKDAA